MEFNLVKCEVQHFVKLNQDLHCKWMGPGKNRESKSTGTQFPESADTVDKMVRKAFGMLGFIGQGTEYRRDIVL